MAFCRRSVLRACAVGQVELVTNHFEQNKCIFIHIIAK